MWIIFAGMALTALAAVVGCVVLDRAVTREELEGERLARWLCQYDYRTNTFRPL
jgi:hypothetical protein